MWTDVNEAQSCRCSFIRSVTLDLTSCDWQLSKPQQVSSVTLLLATWGRRPACAGCWRRRRHPCSRSVQLPSAASSQGMEPEDHQKEEEEKKRKKQRTPAALSHPRDAYPAWRTEKERPKQWKYFIWTVVPDIQPLFNPWDPYRVSMIFNWC